MSNPVLASTTEPIEQMEHAVSEEWRQPFVPKDAPADAAPEAEAAPAETTPDSEAGEETEQQKPTEKKSGWQKRIDKLTARNHAAETRAEKAERELAELRANAAPAKEPPAKPANGAPRLEDFKTAEEWADARDAYKDQQEANQVRSEKQRATFDAYNRSISEIRGKLDDFDEVLAADQDVMLPKSVHVAVIGLKEKGPEVAYYLAKHPEAIAQINEAFEEGDDALAVLELGRIVAGMASSQAAKTGTQKQKVTPPAPLAPVGASSTRSSVPLDQLPPREYNRIRNKQEAEARRGGR